MATQDTTFGSNNPFRRKVGSPPAQPASPAGALNSRPGLDGTLEPSATKPPFTSFKSATQGGVQRESERPIEPKPAKVVKRVRVQSPPPSSPEDALPTTRYPGRGEEDDSSSSSDSSDEYDGADPFDNNTADAGGQHGSERPLPQIPPNPFSKTLQDMERTGLGSDAEALADSAAKSSMDVDAFKRLLLTGYANIPGSGSAPDSGGKGASGARPPAMPPDGNSNTSVQSRSRQSIFDAMKENPRMSHGMSETEGSEDKGDVSPTSPTAAAPSAAARKPPPPPSSRHGKLIRIELGADASPPAHGDTALKPTADMALPNTATARDDSAHSANSSQMQSSSRDVNKPLPPPPARPQEDVDSPFDREAAGKVPEAFAELQAHPRSPTPPPTQRNRSNSQTSTQSKTKPAAPPPRRHGRSDSRTPSITTTALDEDPPRSSAESNLSRAGSLRGNTNLEKTSHAPAPPPPRRPHQQTHRSSYASLRQESTATAAPSSPVADEASPGPTDRSSTTAGAVHGVDGTGGPATAAGGRDGSQKPYRPPPPPTRQPSARRPQSVRSFEVGSGSGSSPGAVAVAARKASKEKDGAVAAPPPPPPRQKGTSRAAKDAASVPEADETGSTRDSSDPAAEASTPSETAETDGLQGEHILADLDALQREVDALRERYPNPQAG
ncbi:hypothetical protein GGR56DRAFT_507677 [Xylariaceae sp. FL0804]|nr:hypothetical protein GGR56DRAFT_507677 [Xylariaceae sp. FL0804]